MIEEERVGCRCPLLWDTSRLWWLSDPFASQGALAATRLLAERRVGLTGFLTAAEPRWVSPGDEQGRKACVLTALVTQGRPWGKQPVETRTQILSSKRMEEKGLSSACFLSPQVSDAEDILGVVQTENIKISAEACEPALSTSVSQGQGVPPKQSNAGAWQCLCRWATKALLHCGQSWALRSPSVWVRGCPCWARLGSSPYGHSSRALPRAVV